MLGRATNSTGPSTRTRLQCLCIGRARCRSSVLYCSVSVNLPPLAGVVGMAVLQNATNSKQRSGLQGWLQCLCIGHTPLPGGSASA